MPARGYLGDRNPAQALVQLPHYMLRFPKEPNMRMRISEIKFGSGSDTHIGFRVHSFTQATDSSGLELNTFPKCGKYCPSHSPTLLEASMSIAMKLRRAPQPHTPHALLFSRSSLLNHEVKLGLAVLDLCGGR